MFIWTISDLISVLFICLFFGGFLAIYLIDAFKNWRKSNINKGDSE